MRDLTKVLSDAEAVKLRALLAQTPDIAPDSLLGAEYPKMLFHHDYVALYRLIKDHPDPLIKKEAQQKMPRVIVVVHNIEDEEEYLMDTNQDGSHPWTDDPVKHMLADGEPDPRIPTGREGRRADKMNKLSRDHELRDLRRRYAQLTGRKLEDEPVALADTAPYAPIIDPPIIEPDKRAKVAAAAKRATGQHASV